LKKELDRRFSIYIRKKYADDIGFIKCYCCGRSLHWAEAQNMHYVSRSHLSLRWDERNCRAGCVGCNVFMNGNYPAYTEHLLDEIGEKELKKLIADGRELKQWGRYELEKEIEKYDE